VRRCQQHGVRVVELTDGGAVAVDGQRGQVQSAARRDVPVARWLGGSVARWLGWPYASVARVAAPRTRSTWQSNPSPWVKAMARIITDIVIHKTFVDGPDVLTWFDLHTTIAPPSPTANWSHVEDGKITRIRVTFDARPLSSPGLAAQS